MVLATMRRRGISGLPRNYELVYEALNASNARLTKDFDNLGRNPAQEDLDALGKLHFPHHHRTGVVEGAHDRISGELEGMLRLLRQEQSSLESYSKLLGETYSRISSKSASSADILSSVIGVLSNATGDTMEKGKIVVEHMVERAREMEQVKLELDEYKRIANTDPLTRLSNRRAFDEMLSNMYNNPREAMYYSLIVADIDHFKKFNDTYGHPCRRPGSRGRCGGDEKRAAQGCLRRAHGRRGICRGAEGHQSRGDHGDRRTHPSGDRGHALEKPEDRRGLRPHYPVAGRMHGQRRVRRRRTLQTRPMWRSTQPRNAGRNRVFVYNPDINQDFEKNWAIYKG